MRALDLADEQDHRDRIVLGDMDAVGRVGRAGPARDEADSRAVRSAARSAIAIIAAPASWRQTVTVDGGVVQRVERGEVGFAGHAVDVLDALRDELVDQKLSTRSQIPAQCPAPLSRRIRRPRFWQFTPFFSIRGAGMRLALLAPPVPAMLEACRLPQNALRRQAR